MDGLEFSFEKGGIIYAKFNDESMETVNRILKALPLVTDVCHTRWCGREIYMPVHTENPKMNWNVTRYVSKFDLGYWVNRKGDKLEETISLYYGPESLRFYGGPLYVEIIGRVLFEQEKLLEEIGERVWLCGKEKVTVKFIK